MYIEKTMMMPNSTNLSNNNNNGDNSGGGGSSSDTAIKTYQSIMIKKQSLRDRIYYTAKDGFSLALCILLKSLNEELSHKLVNEVSIFLLYYFIY